MKHLTFKMVFLLALGSGKRRSEILAWQNKNIRHQSDWSTVSPYLSTQLSIQKSAGQEGPDSVAPVVITAWPHLWIGPSFHLEHCATIWTGPQTSSRIRRWFLSPLRKVSTKTSASISSWIKQTVILCYELSDQEAHSLHQVKTHDVRAFAAPKVLQSGVSLDPILSACHQSHIIPSHSSI